MLAAAIIAIAIAAPPAGAAEYFVPPGNSAATQYTEAVPTARGHRDSEKGYRGDRTPAEVLGKRSAQRLQQQGADGRRVAEVVATTAPAAQPDGQRKERGDGREASTPADRGENGDHEDGVGGGGGTGPEGSSGLSEVVAQATGVSSSGQLGLLLPLAIAASAVWAVAFLLRQRRRSGP